MRGSDPVTMAEVGIDHDADDAALVARARDHADTSAFEELVRRHRDRAYRVAIRVCGNASDAEDVTQEALVRAWRGVPGFRGDARFSTWLYRIVTNLALNRVSRRPPDGVQPPTEGAGSVVLDPARRVEDGERLAVVVAAMEELTAEQRACFVLREVEGLSYDELAEVLGVSVGSVKGRLFRARQDLAAALERYDTGDPTGGATT